VPSLAVQTGRASFPPPYKPDTPLSSPYKPDAPLSPVALQRVAASQRVAVWRSWMQSKDAATRGARERLYSWLAALAKACAAGSDAGPGEHRAVCKCAPLPRRPPPADETPVSVRSQQVLLSFENKSLKHCGR
jgi:hypothetical protein